MDVYTVSCHAYFAICLAFTWFFFAGLDGHTPKRRDDLPEDGVEVVPGFVEVCELPDEVLDGRQRLKFR